MPDLTLGLGHTWQSGNNLAQGLPWGPSSSRALIPQGSLRLSPTNTSSHLEIHPRTWNWAWHSLMSQSQGEAWLHANPVSCIQRLLAEKYRTVGLKIYKGGLVVAYYIFVCCCSSTFPFGTCNFFQKYLIIFSQILTNWNTQDQPLMWLPSSMLSSSLQCILSFGLVGSHLLGTACGQDSCEKQITYNMVIMIM